MVDAYFLHVAREALFLVLLLSAPPLLASLAAGVVTGVLQTVTQVHDPSISSVPRLLVVLSSLVLAGPWIGDQTMRFADALLRAIPALR